MYAPSFAGPLPTDVSFRSKRMRSSVPYCYILDDSYRVIMAGPSGGDNPLASFYDADSTPELLPGPVDRVVRALTAAWRSTRTAASATASVNDLQVTVAPLHGGDGRRIAVFVQRLPDRD